MDRPSDWDSTTTRNADGTFTLHVPEPTPLRRLYLWGELIWKSFVLGSGTIVCGMFWLRGGNRAMSDIAYQIAYGEGWFMPAHRQDAMRYAFLGLSAIAIGATFLLIRLIVKFGFRVRRMIQVALYHRSKARVRRHQNQTSRGQY